MYTSRDVARMFDEFFGNTPPCNFNDLDEKTCENDWCEYNCGTIESVDCWQYAIENGWL